MEEKRWKIIWLSGFKVVRYRANKETQMWRGPEETEKNNWNLPAATGPIAKIK